MTLKMPWFKFYSEALNDRKIIRAARMAQQPKAIIMGVWLTLLCLANESPERGKLMIAEDVWSEEDEIAAETGLDPMTFSKVITAFQKLGMVSVSGGYEIPDWASRQGRQYSQSSEAVRARRYRAKKKEERRRKKEEVEVEEDVDVEEDPSRDMSRDGNRDASRQRHANADDRDIITETGSKNVVTWWLKLVGSGLPRDPGSRQEKYYGPADILLERIGGDVTEARRLLETKRGDMIAEGKTPKYLDAVVFYIIADLDRPEPAADRKSRLEEVLANEGLA